MLNNKLDREDIIEEIKHLEYKISILEQRLNELDDEEHQELMKSREDDYKEAKGM